MKRQHEAFALKVARDIDPTEAYKQTYPKTKNDEAARVSSIRLLKREDVKTLVETKRKEIAAAADTLAIEELKGERKALFLSMALKREILYRIATGKKTIATKGAKGERIIRYPTDQDKIRAIELDNEMTGEGWRPPEPPTPGSGTTINGPVYNTVIRKTVFKTRETTSKGQTFQIEPNE